MLPIFSLNHARVRIFNLFCAMIILVSITSSAQTPDYHCIYGNKYGSTIDVYIGSSLNLKFWGATPVDGDSVIIINHPLASQNDYVAERQGGEIFRPDWTWTVSPPDSNSPPGYTTQSIFAGCELMPPCFPLYTGGDTVLIGYISMSLENDSSLMGQLACPFIEGFDPVNGGILWGLWGGIDAVFPSQSFSCLYFVDYLAGDANGSGIVNGLDVTYLVAYLKGYVPAPDPILSGDANGDCQANGMDISYLVAYFKGGPAPFLGNCH